MILVTAEAGGSQRAWEGRRNGDLRTVRGRDSIQRMAPSGFTAKVRSSSGGSAVAPVIDGGFDPVAADQ